MAFFEFIQHLLSLDFIWLINVIIHNIPYLFAYSAAVYFFYQGKNFLRWFVIIVIYVWVAVEFVDIAGWVVLSAGFLSLNYLVRIGALTFTDALGFGNRLPLLMAIMFVMTLAIYNIFILGVS